MPVPSARPGLRCRRQSHRGSVRAVSPRGRSFVLRPKPPGFLVDQDRALPLPLPLPLPLHAVRVPASQPPDQRRDPQAGPSAASSAGSPHSPADGAAYRARRDALSGRAARLSGDRAAPAEWQVLIASGGRHYHSRRESGGREHRSAGRPIRRLISSVASPRDLLPVGRVPESAVATAVSVSSSAAPSPESEGSCAGVRVGGGRLTVPNTSPDRGGTSTIAGSGAGPRRIVASDGLGR